MFKIMSNYSLPHGKQGLRVRLHLFVSSNAFKESYFNKHIDLLACPNREAIMLRTMLFAKMMLSHLAYGACLEHM